MTSEKDPEPSDLPPIGTLTESPVEPTLSPTEPILAGGATGPSTASTPTSVTSEDFLPLDELIRTQTEEASETLPIESTSGSVTEDTTSATSELSLQTPSETLDIPGADLPMAPGSEPAPFTNSGPMSPLDRIREFSDNIAPSPSQVPASLPFSLKIDGILQAADRARLLDFLANENLGVREIDLEPQLESGRILIPQISEYAGVAIVHLLRDSGARFRLGPADRVFSGQASAGSSPPPTDADATFSHSVEDQPHHKAETIPVLAGDVLPGKTSWTVIDTLVASTTLKANVVEFTQTREFDEMVEALKRELRYKAFHRGGIAVLQYTLQLAPLAVPTQYRVIVSGVAVRS